MVEGTRLNEQLYTVIGVLPKSFSYPDPLIQLWVPFHLDNPADGLQSHFNHTSNVIALLKPGASAQRATEELNAFQYQTHQNLYANGVVHDGVSQRPC